MAEGTLLTHVNRVRQNHPELYSRIREVRLAQLRVRHRFAMQNAQALITHTLQTLLCACDAAWLVVATGCTGHRYSVGMT